MFTIKFAGGYWSGYDDVSGEPIVAEFASAARRTFYARAVRLAESFTRRGMICQVVRS
jgi:hypothetical protein